MIGKEPSDPNRFTSGRLFTSAARTAFSHLLGHLRARPDINTERPILLPAYIGFSPREGSGVFDPIVEHGLDYAFYDLDETLSTDLDNLQSCLARLRPFAVVVIHYFGIPQPDFLVMRELCDQHGVLLIEDCAHSLDALIGDGILGHIGDYSLFSIHKLLPTRDGGILQINIDDPTVPAVPATIAMTPSTLAILCNADLETIRARRSANYGLLSPMLTDITGVRPFIARRPSGATPLNFPVLIDTADRHAIYRHLREQDIGVVALYHTLVTAISASDHPTPYRISQTILNLPTHQEVAAEMLEPMALALANAMQQLTP